MSTDMIWQTSSTSSAATEKLGELLGSQLGGGEVIELNSDLGGGKTTFVRGLARGAGSHNNVASPTFTLNRRYQTKKFNLSHFDFYRLDDPGILAEQLAESVADGDVVVIEWAAIVDNVLPKSHITVKFEQTANDPDERRITFYYPQSKRPIFVKLETDWQTSQP